MEPVCFYRDLRYIITELIIVPVLASRCLISSMRLTRCPGSTCVYYVLLTRGRKNPASDAGAIAFSSIRSTGISSTARASCSSCPLTKKLRRSVRTAPNRCTTTGLCRYRILRRRRVFAFLLSFRHHNVYRTTFRSTASAEVF